MITAKGLTHFIEQMARDVKAEIALGCVADGTSTPAYEDRGVHARGPRD